MFCPVLDASTGTAVFNDLFFDAVLRCSSLLLSRLLWSPYCADVEA
jgi:hypothetical protein